MAKFQRQRATWGGLHTIPLRLSWITRTNRQGPTEIRTWIPFLELKSSPRSGNSLKSDIPAYTHVLTGASTPENQVAI